MRIGLLLSHQRGRRRIREAIHLRDFGRALWPTRTYSSWARLMADCVSGDVEIVVIDPGAGTLAHRCPTIEEIEGIRDEVGWESVVFYSDLDGQSWDLIRELNLMGFVHVLTPGVDDGLNQILRVLGAAGCLRSLCSRRDSLEPALGPGGCRTLIQILAHSYNAVSVSEISKKLHMSPRSLRRIAAASRLPPPNECHRWFRLLLAESLLKGGIGSTQKLSSILGYRDPASLPRLCRQLTHASWNQLRNEGSSGFVMAAFFRRISSYARPPRVRHLPRPG